MSRGTPVAREIKWPFVLPQVLALVACVAIGSYVVGYPGGLIGGAAVYLIYSYGSRALLTRHHRRGIGFMRRGEWMKALGCFEQSAYFFERWAWIDRFRPIVLMSSSGASYHEMALLNQAACSIHLERGAEARELYERVLELYPESPLASSALKVMDLSAAGR